MPRGLQQLNAQAFDKGFEYGAQAMSRIAVGGYAESDPDARNRVIEDRPARTLPRPMWTGIHPITVRSENGKLPILAISGSLRSASSNTAALEAVRSLAPAGAEVTIFRGLGDLPHFNPDLDGDQVPRAVQELRTAVSRAAAILISSPEYAHGVAGAMKNLLDWLVSSLEFPGKPVGIINAAPRAFHADTALKETLTTMSAKLVPGACIAVPIAGRLTDPKEIAADLRIAGRLVEAVEELVRAAVSD